MMEGSGKGKGSGMRFGAGSWSSLSRCRPDKLPRSWLLGQQHLLRYPRGLAKAKEQLSTTLGHMWHLYRGTEGATLCKES